jgi:hypothetical protein
LLPASAWNVSAASVQAGAPSIRHSTALPVWSWLPGLPPSPANWLPV